MKESKVPVRIQTQSGEEQKPFNKASEDKQKMYVHLAQLTFKL
jgi:hypothetical protein